MSLTVELHRHSAGKQTFVFVEAEESRTCHRSVVVAVEPPHLAA